MERAIEISREFQTLPLAYSGLLFVALNNIIELSTKLFQLLQLND